jgi:TRAP-type C4-dicarboxylate transport system substrate-binding protein
MNEGTWNKISKADQAVIEKLSGETAARMFGRGWDSVDRRANAFMQTAGVVNTLAAKSFVEEIRGKTAPLEQKWVADAKAKGLTNAEQVLKEFRAEIAKN